MPLLSERAGGDKPTREYDRVHRHGQRPDHPGPHVLHGRFEGLKDVQAEPASYTVPTLKMRQGDLSEFTTVVYDPATRRAATTSVRPSRATSSRPTASTRSPRPTSPCIPSRTVPGRAATTSRTSSVRTTTAVLGRVDHNFNSSTTPVPRRLLQQAPRGPLQLGARPPTRDRRRSDQRLRGDARIRLSAANTGVTARLHLGARPTPLRRSRPAAQFGEWRDPAHEFDPATLRFSEAAEQLMGGYQYLPFITFGGFSTTNSELDDRLARRAALRLG